MRVPASALAIVMACAVPAYADPSVSQQCLVCHDGTSAPDVLTEPTHPTAVEYVETRQGQMRLRAKSLPSGFGGTIEQDLLVDGRVECTSCHVDHATETDKPFRLRMRETVTQLCLACHVPAK